MNRDIDIHPLQEAAELRLLADVLELGHLTGKAASVRPIPMMRGENGQRFIAIGTPAQVRALLADPAPAALLNVEELAALRRFDECAQDGEGYDVQPEMMARLTEIGVVRRLVGRYFKVTDFGLRVLEGGAA